MLKSIVSGALCIMLATSGAFAQDADETAAWEQAKESATSEEVFQFIERYPNSVFAKEAKAHMIDLLWQELDDADPEVATEETVAAAPATSTTVRFSEPLTEGSADIVGRSLEELISSTPLFPPVEGLDEEYWKEQKCSNCHEWKQANLCTQANTYLSDAGAENLIKKHPYGGAFKLNLRTWAQDGCN